MPWRQEWFDAPKNTQLTVYKELPIGITERGWQLTSLKEATGYIDGKFKTFHFCYHCGGWIEGHANQYEVNTLSPNQLAGRQGIEYFCLRCGDHIAFDGMMS